MYVNNSNFSFCKETGLMKENFSIQSILNSIENSLKNSDTSEDFIKAFKSFVANTSNIKRYICVTYRYDMNVDYVVGNKSYNGRIANFGNCGAPDSLKVTKFYKDGDYTVVKNVSSQVPYPVWNERNVFSFEEIKSALSQVIEDQMPKGWKSYQSKDWTVSAFLIPVFCIILTYNGKSYSFYGNLHNGSYYYQWETDPIITKKTQLSKKLCKIMVNCDFIFSIFLIIFAFFRAIFKHSWFGFLIGIVAAVATYFLQNSKYKIEKKAKAKFIKNRKLAVPVVLIPQIIETVAVLIAFIIILCL